MYTLHPGVSKATKNSNKRSHKPLYTLHPGLSLPEQEYVRYAAAMGISKATKGQIPVCDCMPTMNALSHAARKNLLFLSLLLGPKILGSFREPGSAVGFPSFQELYSALLCF